MKKLTLILTAAALALGVMAVSASAAQYPGAAALHAQIQNATPIEKAACGGFGPYCPPGMTRVCNRWHCWCRPCYWSAWARRSKTSHRRCKRRQFAGAPSPQQIPLVAPA